MVEGLKKGYYIPPRKRREIQKSFLISLLTHDPNLFLLSDLEYNKKNGNSLKKRHTLKNQRRRSNQGSRQSLHLHQEVSEFNPSDQMSIDQLVKLILNLQEKVRKLRKENEKLLQQILHGLQGSLGLRMANVEREIDALWKFQQEQFSKTSSQVQRIQDQSQQIEIIMSSQRIQQIPLEQINSDKMELRRILSKRKQLNQNSRFRNYPTIVKVNIVLKEMQIQIQTIRVKRTATSCRLTTPTLSLQNSRDILLFFENSCQGTPSLWTARLQPLPRANNQKDCVPWKRLTLTRDLFSYRIRACLYLQSQEVQSEGQPQLLPFFQLLKEMQRIQKNQGEILEEIIITINKQKEKLDLVQRKRLSLQIEEDL